ncbi:helix-turn-helix domain-containing protein [Escherichia coli]|uniref:helix-turn-helix domain-containing protein n=1 Tax=Enterobacteriaceae TaxID=543 RepID=UPI00163FFE0A|nr:MULTISPECIES: helix-turn-helix domain-containing protein [Enterobacteriaceae]EJB4398344.1 helix-turn-helix domain-containing protein [Escherichia coli]EJE0818531.1 helix-turn-helix domain-containing protein [Escherichia coli]ELV1387135.1 helix-turn-helix domain-containing protein [Escherichia coli]MDG5580970.1 helix-turn-helix domain-containing protein [Escherichia coli]MDG5617888.1 helix-turn-helix domain-containing protein [Escherichia coli]
MIKNIKTIAEAKAKCLNQKDGKQKYVVVEQWLKMFKKWFSPSGNEYTATLPAVEIYSYIAGFNEQGQECYATQKTLSNIGMVSDRQVRNIINMFVDMGVLSVEARDGQTSLYKALPFTDAHITPPGESSLPDPSEKENESNEILNVSEIIIEEETQESAFPERPEIFTWLLSLDKKKPPHEETEDFVKRALDSKNIYLEKQAFHDLIISLREKSEIYDSIPF